MIVQMLVLQGKQRGQQFQFPVGEFVFGRGPECQVRPDSDWISRQHCLLRVSGEGSFLRDLGSTNGTLVNGVRIKGETALQNGDILQLGPVALQIQFTTPSQANKSTLQDGQPQAGTLGDTQIIDPKKT